MPPNKRLRKLQDPTLVQALEAALERGDSMKVALGSLNVAGSTLRRDMQRDEDLRQRVALAVQAGRAVRKGKHPARFGLWSGRAVAANELTTAQPTAPPPSGAAPEAGPPRRMVSDSIQAGTGRVVSRSPVPAPAFGRWGSVAAESAGVAARRDAAIERAARHDWLPPFGVLVGEVVIAFVSTRNLIVVIGAMVVATAYAGLMLSRGSEPAPAQIETPVVPSPPPEVVRHDLRWLHGTIGEPMEGQGGRERRWGRPRD